MSLEDVIASRLGISYGDFVSFNFDLRLDGFEDISYGGGYIRIKGTNLLIDRLTNEAINGIV